MDINEMSPEELAVILSALHLYKEKNPNTSKEVVKQLINLFDRAYEES